MVSASRHSNKAGSKAGRKAGGKVNPYSEWIYDHPLNLLPHPSRSLLEEKRASGPTCSGKLILELGSGSGAFLLQLAARAPGCHLVGFELRYKRLVKAARKLDRANLRNVWLLREVAENFHHYFDPGTVDRVYINFPDPWPKAGQWKKRLLSPGLLAQLESTLKPGGRVCLKTDHSGYFLHILSLLRERAQWRILHFSNDLHRFGPPGRNLRTEFEQLFASKRKPIFFLDMDLLAMERAGRPE